MPRRVSLAVTICTTLFPALVAQQPIPSHITDEVLAADASSYPQFQSGLSIEETISKHLQYDNTHKTFVVAFHPNEEVPVGGHGKKDELAEVRGLTLNSDAVIVGTPVLRRSALTSSLKFIFFDYDVVINSVLVDKSGMLASAASLVVTRPGGETQIDGCEVRAIETEFPLFRLNTQYIFFLHRQASGAYLVGPSDALLTNGNSLLAARNHPKYDLAQYSLPQVEHEILMAAALSFGRAK